MPSPLEMAPKGIMKAKPNQYGKLQAVHLLALWLEENRSEVWGKESAELLTAWLDA